MPHSGPRGFWIFFNEIMMGKEKTINKKCSFLAEITIDQIQEKLTSITREFTQKIDQDVVNKSEINIYCGSDNTTLKDYQLLHRKREYNIHTGKVKPGSGCLTYGCCFDVLQNSNVELYAINEASSKDVQKLENIISTEIVANMKISGGCKDKHIEAVQKTLLEQKLRNEEIISEEIKKSKITMAEVSQKIDLRYDEPLLCVNQCNETPSAGKIRQISNVNIMTRSMIKSIIESTENNILNARADSGMEIEMREDANTELKWSIMSAAIIVTVYLISCKILAPLLVTILCKIARIPSQATRKPLEYFGFILYNLLAAIMMYIWWRLWKFGWCIHKANGIVQVIMCFHPLILKILFTIPCGICDFPLWWCGDGDVKKLCNCVWNGCNNDTKETCNNPIIPV